VTIDIVVADDLTGAADTVVQFLPVVDHVLVFPTLRRFEQAVADRALPAGELAIGVSTVSRHVGSVQAARHVRLAHLTALLLWPRLLFHKVDSALRGNPESELAAYLAATGEPGVLMSPAFPPSRRSVRDGVLYVGGVPLAESEVGRDPRTPATESSVPALLGRHSFLPISTIPLGSVRGSQEELTARVRALAAGITVADAETPDDLARIARAVVDAGLLHAISGSAGLARQLSVLLPRSARRGIEETHLRARRILVVIGSPHPRARAQIAHAVRERAGVLSPVYYGWAVDPAKWEFMRLLETVLRREECAIVLPPFLDNMSRWNSDAILQSLATMAQRLIERTTPNGEPLVDALVVSGGDTAAALCSRFGTEHIELVDEVFPGAPLGVMRGGLTNGIPIVTKSGAHGPDDGLVRIIERLRGAAGSLPSVEPGAAV